MARNTERDVELVIKARDEAERALTRITGALTAMGKAQQNVTGTAKNVDGALANLTKEVADLDAKLAALGDMAVLTKGLEKAADSVNRLETDVAQTTDELARLKRESEQAAAAVVAAEQKKAAAANGTKQERQAANQAVREAKREETTLATQMDKQNAALQARIDKLERATKAYEELKSAAGAAGNALGVQPTSASVQSAQASTGRQRQDVAELAAFRATSEQNEAIRQRLEYERTWATLLNEREASEKELARLAAASQAEEQALAEFRATAKQNEEINRRLNYERLWRNLLDDREEQQKAANEASKEQLRLQKESEAAFQREQQRSNANNRADYERFWAQAINEREQQERQAAQAAEEAAAAQSQLVRQAERLKGQLNPLGAAQDRYNKELAEMERMLERGLIDQKQFTQGQAMLERQLRETEDALNDVNAAGGAKGDGTVFLGLRPYELTNLSYQINDVVTGIASGQPAVQILAQQGGQFFQIFSRQMQGMAARMVALGPIIGGVTAAVVVLGSAVVRAFRDQGNIREFSGLLMATATSAEYTTEKLAAATAQIDKMSVSTDEARQIVRNFVKEGLNPDLMVAFGEAAKDLASVMGMEVPDAAKALAEGLTGGYEQIVELNNATNAFTDDQMEYIKVQFEAGRADEARRFAFEALYRSMDKGAKEMKGPWAEATSRLGRAWSDFLDKLAGTGIVQGMVWALQKLADVADLIATGFEKAGQALDQFTGKGEQATIFGIPIRDTILGALGFGGGSDGQSAGQGGNSGMSSRFVDRVVGAESSGRANARNRLSSATGGGQFIEATWLRMFRQYFPERAQNMGREQILALRNDMQLSRRMIELYAEENARVLRQAGVAINDANLYLAHFAGAQTASRVLRADPNTPVSDIFSSGAIDANRRVLGNGQTAGGLVAWANRRMGTGGVPAGPITVETENQRARGRDAIEEERRRLLLERNLLDNSRADAARLEARRKAQSEGLRDRDVEILAEMAYNEEMRKLALERAEVERQILSETNTFRREANRALGESLEDQLKDVDAQTDQVLDNIRRARQRGLTEVDGQPIAQLETQVRAAGEVRKQQTEFAFREREINALLQERATRLDEIRARYEESVATGQGDPNAFLGEFDRALNEYQPRLQQMAASAADFAREIGGAEPSERMQAFIRRMETIGGDTAALRRAENQRVLNDAERAYNDLLQARDARLADIQARYKDVDPQTLFEKTQEIIDDFAPQIGAAADKAIALARALAGMTISPEMQAFIARAEQGGASSAVLSRQLRSDQLRSAETELNDRLAARQARIAVINAELERGNISRAEAERREIALYEGTQPLIDEYIAKKRAILELMARSGDLTQAQYDIEIAGLERVGIESARVDERAKAMKESLESAFQSSVMNGVDTFARGIAEGKSAIESLGDAFRQFAADFLMQIGRMIMQQIILNALQGVGGMSIPGMGSGVPGMSGGGGIFGQMATNILRPGGGFGGFQYHNGGIVGGGGAPRSVVPGWFANAVQYHNGGIAGLRPDEFAAVLQRNEEVLTTSDPRHRFNGGAMPEQKINIINTFDPGEFVSKGLGTRAGERAIMNFMRVNSREIKGALG